MPGSKTPVNRAKREEELVKSDGRLKSSPGHKESGVRPCREPAERSGRRCGVRRGARLTLLEFG